MEKPKFLGQGEWTAYLDNRDERIPIIANGKAVAFIPPLHEDAIAIATLIPIAVNAYYPMLEALKGTVELLEKAAEILDLKATKNAAISTLSPKLYDKADKIKAAIALAEKADEYKGKFNNNEEGRSMQASLQKVKEMVNAALVQEGLDEMRAQKGNKQ